MRPLLIVCLTALAATPTYAASPAQDLRNEAEAFCEIHNPKYWPDVDSMSLEEYRTKLGDKISEVVKSKEFRAALAQSVDMGHEAFKKNYQGNMYVFSRDQVRRVLSDSSWDCEYMKFHYGEPEAAD
ncbi:hypothetical protein EUZ85_19630 [Hahella sp. KA22]|uniref:hypothetical protein n=1 Tax=Hahella sp. KA22 TaxID=1628392 RepID=UPI000FDCFBB4|nr:hypothetical protein [Hahella sp. KA22]AZZ92816.1 hypothetical protein ENC22_17050 [Hahella sp. KA22]QAY56190.1 hypothetical protein EUZ85_19630 [Hahella sp. KA22]